MNTQMEEIRQMQAFLGETDERPITIYRKQYDGREGCSYEEFLISYAKELRRNCEIKLINDFHANLGKRLFAEKFASFQEFAR